MEELTEIEALASVIQLAVAPVVAKCALGTLGSCGGSGSRG
jgi:hypothetical protein